MRFTICDEESKEIASDVYYSIGGGFIIDAKQPHSQIISTHFPYPFGTAKELLEQCGKK